MSRLGDVQVHGRLCTATGKLTCILNINHHKLPINVQLMSFYQIHQRKSVISNLPTKISTYLSGPEVFYKPARVVTPQWVFVLDQWVFVLDHRVFGLRSSFLGLRFRHIHSLQSSYQDSERKHTCHRLVALVFSHQSM